MGWSQAPCLERDVVVGVRRAEIGRVGANVAGRHVLRLAVAVAAAAEELDRVGDDLDRLALGPVLGVPLAPVEATVDRDGAALRQELCAALALVPPTP
jgi:hypothetical protein